MNRVSTRPVIAVDVGNSALKLTVLCPPGDESVFLPSVVDCVATDDPLAALAAHLPQAPAAWFVVRVRRQREAQLATWVATHRPRDTYCVLENGDFPLVVAVRQRDRVGTDRLAAATAVARLRQPGQPAIIVDAGTATTVDLLDGHGVFQGGAILPGPATAAAALAHATEALPNVLDIDLASMPDPVGKCTEAAIRSGIAWGAVGAVRELLAQYIRLLPVRPTIFVTGGAGPPLARQLALASGDVSGCGDQTGRAWPDQRGEPCCAVLAFPNRYVPHLVLSGVALAGWQRLANASR